MEVLDKLFFEWSNREHHRGKGFIRDGIIDEIRWFRTHQKVLLLLKEAYGEHEGELKWDLCKLIREEWKGPKHHIWHQAASWCYAAQNIKSNDKRFPTKEEAADALLQAAFINIKKSDGLSASDNEEIARYAQKDGDLIKRQIELIEPAIILCGNTWSAVKYLWPEAQEDYDMVWKTENFTFVDFWHPAGRFPDGLAYYALVCLLQNGIA